MSLLPTNMKACLQIVSSLPFYSSYSSTEQCNENRLPDFQCSRSQFSSAYKKPDLVSLIIRIALETVFTGSCWGFSHRFPIFTEFHRDLWILDFKKFHRENCEKSQNFHREKILTTGSQVHDPDLDLWWSQVLGIVEVLALMA